MIARERKREADEIQTLKARLDELERTLRNQPAS